MAKVAITNTINPGPPRGVESRDHGTIYIEPGETVEVELLDDRPLYEGLEAGAAAAKKAAKASDAPDKSE